MVKCIINLKNAYVDQTLNSTSQNYPKETHECAKSEL